MRSLILVALLAGATLSHAQTASTSTPAKKELVAKLLTLQQPGIENVARGLLQQPASAMLQQADQVLRTQVPPERRESVAKSIDAVTRKYFEEATPLLRDRAVKLAPTVLGPALEEKFSEDELKQLVAWLENPVNKKFQQFTGDMQKTFMEKLVADGRPVVDPKIQALEQGIRAALSGPADAASAPAAPPKPASAAARPPARAASK